MKFKGPHPWRDLTFKDKYGDDATVSVARDDSTRIYISASSVSMSPRKARKFAKAILKELDR